MGIKVWVMTLLSYEHGKVEIIKSFSKPAKDSDAKLKKKEPKKTFKVSKVEEKELF